MGGVAITVGSTRFLSAAGEDHAIDFPAAYPFYASSTNKAWRGSCAELRQALEPDPQALPHQGFGHCKLPAPLTASPFLTAVHSGIDPA